MVDKAFYLAPILPLSIIRITAVMIMMLRYKYIFKDETIMLIRKRIVFQLNASCIIHCLTHFLLIFDIGNKELDFICHIEGVLTIIFLHSTLLFTVILTFFTVIVKVVDSNKITENKNKIMIAVSIIGWGFPGLLCIIFHLPLTGEVIIKAPDDFNCF